MTKLFIQTYERNYHFVSLQIMVHASIYIKNKDNIKAPCYWRLVRGTNRWLMDSPHKGPVIRKAFPSHGVIMSTLFRFSMQRKLRYWIIHTCKRMEYFLVVPWTESVSEHKNESPHHCSCYFHFGVVAAPLERLVPWGVGYQARSGMLWGLGVSTHTLAPSSWGK